MYDRAKYTPQIVYNIGSSSGMSFVCYGHLWQCVSAQLPSIFMWVRRVKRDSWQLIMAEDAILDRMLPLLIFLLATDTKLLAVSKKELRLQTFS
jgi:hypothetical protein